MKREQRAFIPSFALFAFDNYIIIKPNQIVEQHQG
ncbi:hypothetical protein NIES4071_103190 (plasmid) [Calothrix sp. NIES-4071]|nr:hypothetical protein NIES4071_103190 [Calothrix sp. NIES-4071]BAZ64700.1 hypothetical protein NIES4105_104330 [Calothrix sp. NIES-4105]